MSRYSIVKVKIFEGDPRGCPTMNDLPGNYSPNCTMMLLPGTHPVTSNETNFIK